MSQRNNIDTKLAETRAVIDISQHGFHFALILYFATLDPNMEVPNELRLIVVQIFFFVRGNRERYFGGNVAIGFVQEFILNGDLFLADESRSFSMEMRASFLS